MKIFTVLFLSTAAFRRSPISTSCQAMMMSTDVTTEEVDKLYPGTAVTRMLNIRSRVKSLTQEELSGDWEITRRHILFAGGLRDLPQAVPGKGYTGHSFNDYNHVDLTAMLEEVSHFDNSDGKVVGISRSNRLGEGIKIASIPDLGVGGSWSTCQIGSNVEPPQDVAHIQFRSRIAFKLVWCPPAFNKFVLVDDDGNLLNYGIPTGELPPLRERQRNYQVVAGSKYAKEADIRGKIVF